MTFEAAVCKLLCRLEQSADPAWIRKFLYSIVALLLVSGVQVAQAGSTLVMRYGDFGPQAMAHELIGMEWWQWQAHGDDRPRQYDIKVVVYRDIGLPSVKRLYPVIPEKQQDYRYVEYQAALDHLSAGIAADVIPAVTERLRESKARILRHFNEGARRRSVPPTGWLVPNGRYAVVDVRRSGVVAGGPARPMGRASKTCTPLLRTARAPRAKGCV